MEVDIRNCRHSCDWTHRRPCHFRWSTSQSIPQKVRTILGSFDMVLNLSPFRGRRGFFLHTRMDDNSANVEITNPMFGGDDFDDDLVALDGLSSQPFAIDVDDKVWLSFIVYKTSPLFFSEYKFYESHVRIPAEPRGRKTNASREPEWNF